ncbi:glycosyltransferase [Clostridium frigidicarnis]|uniref:Glycosyltransferase n=1 Tax=Clostridium frigidicarnis TaxID=84698 RepID=A0A1I0WTX3_9CLOT|nr:glycosyltransferase [Clostridium frigidicarnis]SFA91628.1 hypothetical protein SAMN04488528_100627 [Clostridium frigidicarnis]
MKKFFTVLVTLLLSLTLLMTPYKVQCAEDKSSKETCFSKSQVDLKMSERKLWSDHVLWTRNFIISDLASLEDKDAVLQRLLKNQDDIGNAIKPYYGEEAGNNLSKLLREHITIAGQVVDAAKNGNKKDLEKYNKDWYENADKISEFLSSANPNWSNKDLKDMLYKHLQLTTDEVLARLNKDWKADIAAYDKGENHMLMFADMLSNGIMKQFPEKFK